MTKFEMTSAEEQTGRRHGAKAWAALGVAALMFTAACSDGGGEGAGGSEGENGGQKVEEKTEEKTEDPKETLREALKDQETWKEQKATFAVEASEEQLQEIVDAMAEGGEMTEADRKSADEAMDLLKDMALTMEARSTTDTALADMKDLSGADWSFTAEMGEGRAVQMMEVGESEYFLRADVMEIMRSMGPDGESTADELKAQFADAPEEYQWLVKGLEGSWLALDKKLGSEFDKAVAEEVERIEDEAGDQKPADFALEYADVEKTGDTTYEANIRLKEMLEENPELMETETSGTDGASASSSASPSAGGGQEDMDEALEMMNDKPFPITYTIEDGKVTAMEMDVMDILDVVDPPKDAKPEEVETFEKARETELPVKATMSDEADTLEVPKDAVQVTEEDMNAVFGGMSGSTGSGPSGSTGSGGSDF